MQNKLFRRFYAAHAAAVRRGRRTLRANKIVQISRADNIRPYAIMLICNITIVAYHRYPCSKSNFTKRQPSHTVRRNAKNLPEFPRVGFRFIILSVFIFIKDESKPR